MAHILYMNHNCNQSKEANMKVQFQDNKNKILNDLKAKKQKQTQGKVNSATDGKSFFGSQAIKVGFQDNKNKILNDLKQSQCKVNSPTDGNLFFDSHEIKAGFQDNKFKILNDLVNSVTPGIFFFDFQVIKAGFQDNKNKILNDLKAKKHKQRECKVNSTTDGNFHVDFQVIKAGFQDNKNKILNDLKAKKQKQTECKVNSTTDGNFHIDFQVIKAKATGGNFVKELDRHYLRIIQNCQVQFDQINAFPIHRYYDKKETLCEIITKLKAEFNLLGNFCLSEKTDLYVKNPFEQSKSLAKLSSIKNGDTLILSRENDN
jgi:hypothetical protein